MQESPGILDESFQVQGRHDGSGHRCGTDVVHVSHRAGQTLRIGLPQRHVPDRVLLRRTDIHQLAGRLVIVAVKSWQFRAQGDASRPGQGGHVDDQFRRGLVRQRQCVAEHDPAFRIGVANLHG